MLFSRATYLCVGNFASLKAQGETIRAKQEAEHVPQGGSHHTMTLCTLTCIKSLVRNETKNVEMASLLPPQGFSCHDVISEFPAQ